MADVGSSAPVHDLDSCRRSGDCPSAHRSGGDGRVHRAVHPLRRLASGRVSLERCAVRGVHAGTSDVATYLDRIVASRKMKDRSARARRVGADQSFDGCHLLYIASSESGRLPRIIDKTRGKPVLTVGDTTGFAERGVHINLFVEQRHVRFEVNQGAAKASNLKISSQLLSLARLVGGPPAGVRPPAAPPAPGSPR